jgi:sulfur-oxidizing protein SoxY
MGMRRTLFIAAALLLQSLAVPETSRADDEVAAREERWTELQRAIFPDRKISDGAGVLELDAPPRALDAALVPLSVHLVGETPVKAIYLIIDNNPGPLAGRFTFGPAADPRTLKVRMRVNTYTNIHAVAEDHDGNLYAVAKFVKASGGCSAPAGSNDPESLKSLGQMKLKLLSQAVIGQPLQAQLMIRHPNFNGMQMDQLTRLHAPAHFIRTIDVSFAGESVLHVESDIALSTDPVVTFGFVPQRQGRLRVEVKDSKDQSYLREFDLQAAQLSEP